MMVFHFTLAKILSVKENEKNMMEIDYRNAFQNFEQIANVLYEFLKQKEEIGQRQFDRMSKGAPILDVRRLQADMEMLQLKIDHHEVLYRNAQEYAEQKKEILLEQSIDVKRFEKLRDLEHDDFLRKNKAAEMSALDEISTIRHMQQ